MHVLGAARLMKQGRPKGMEWQREIERAKRQHIFLFRPQEMEGKKKEDLAARLLFFLLLAFLRIQGDPDQRRTKQREKGKKGKKNFFFPDPRSSSLSVPLWFSLPFFSHLFPLQASVWLLFVCVFSDGRCETG